MWLINSKRRREFVGKIYASHNRSPIIKQKIQKCLDRLKYGEKGLNIGAGTTDLHPLLVNLDIIPSSTVHCCSLAEYLPFLDSSFSVIISQETLEHVQDPYRAMQEIYRVLKRGGIFYCQLPFIIGYHPGPSDYLRFTKEGIYELVTNPGFFCEEMGIAVGPAIGFYRIIVEFTAILFSQIFSRLYLPIKGLAALLFFPIKLFDSFLSKNKQADRIAGGYYIIAKK